MWFPATVTTPATSEPVLLDEAKRQVRVDFSDDDGYIGDLISTARNHVEKYCGAYRATQTVEAQTDRWCDLSHLSVRPARSVVSLAYIDVGGNTQTVATTVYELRGDAIVLKFGQVWPPMQYGSLITLTAVVGFVTVEPAVKHAILIRISDLYETRETAAETSFTSFDSLLSNHRYY